jgi:quinol monooxygenase YgiN
MAGLLPAWRAAPRVPGMGEPLIFVDTSEIREGKVDELRRAVAELAEFVERNEPAPISYQVYFSADGHRMTVLQIHPDSVSMKRHMEVAGPVFARFADLLTLGTIDIYGVPSERVLEQLRKKAELLGTATVVVHDLQAGFVRLGAQLVR